MRLSYIKKINIIISSYTEFLNKTENQKSKKLYTQKIITFVKNKLDINMIRMIS